VYRAKAMGVFFSHGHRLLTSLTCLHACTRPGGLMPSCASVVAKEAPGAGVYGVLCVRVWVCVLGWGGGGLGQKPKIRECIA
jgi:hypothetical protein